MSLPIFVTMTLLYQSSMSWFVQSYKTVWLVSREEAGELLALLILYALIKLSRLRGNNEYLVYPSLALN